ncbi:hypothetical protein EVAR_5156_1 [Eumeta japonica]|uniref:Uncharacterized protein n=1 Tax=Eumeta variegata TaxID=151549 RepID=A0A4C1SX75_EUMVA|nr:hypothetical protein EVAR_5156_1 [Eumeta japonica]
MDCNTERLSVCFCCTNRPRSASILPGLAVLLNNCTFKTSMKRKVFDTLFQIEIGENKCRIIKISNKMIRLFSWKEETLFSQVSSLLLRWGIGFRERRSHLTP